MVSDLSGELVKNNTTVNSPPIYSNTANTPAIDNSATRAYRPPIDNSAATITKYPPTYNNTAIANAVQALAAAFVALRPAVVAPKSP